MTVSNKITDIADEKLSLLVESIPEGSTHYDSGPSIYKWLKINPYTHDYWEPAYSNWFTFRGGHNQIEDHWIPVATLPQLTKTEGL